MGQNPGIGNEARKFLTIEPIGALVPGEFPCSDELIRIPGSIQPHGFLIGLDVTEKAVAFASENPDAFLNLPLKSLTGSPLDLFLSLQIMETLKVVRETPDPVGNVTYLGALQAGARLFSVLTHLTDGQRVLEFERQDRPVGPETMNAVMTNFVGTLSRLRNQADTCQAITRQISELTGFDRVLLYCFDEAGHGTVLSESNSGTLPSYLGLRFPATDIPAQARALYISNTIRIIPNAVYDPIPLHGNVSKSLDMSSCVLRSVSPVHLEYMQNMGTIASMSISIICEGQLWGLISAHHSQPRLVPYLIRSACDMLSKVISTQLISFEVASKLETMVRFHHVQRNMMTLIAAENDYLTAVAAQVSDLLDITDADGVVLALDGDFEASGAPRKRKL